MIELKKCPICDTEDNWKNLDYLRDQKEWYDKNMRDEDEPVGFKICKECGYLTYDHIDPARLTDSYNLQRILVQPGNITSCNRKNEYHKAFFEEPGKYIKPDMKIMDVGTAQGALLNFLHTEYGVPKKNLYGTEYSSAFRSFGKHEYGLNVTQEIPEDEKFNIVSYYHVLEHVQFLEKEMKKIDKILADDGLFYCSVPLYLDVFEDSAGGIANNFEDIYHLNHINCFSKQAFFNLCNKFGWEVIKENYTYYTGTFWLKKSKNNVPEFIKEDYEEKIKIIQNQKDAVELLNNKKGDKAVELYPKFPDAYILHSLNMKNMKSYDAQIEWIEKGLDIMPDNVRLLNQLAKVYFQWDENKPDMVKFYSNNIKKSEKLFEQLLVLKPGQEDAYYFLAHIEGKFKKNYNKAVDHLKKFMEVNPMKWHESWNLISYYRNEQEKEKK